MQTLLPFATTMVASIDANPSYSAGFDDKYRSHSYFQNLTLPQRWTHDWIARDCIVKKPIVEKQHQTIDLQQVA